MIIEIADHSEMTEQPICPAEISLSVSDDLDIELSRNISHSASSSNDMSSCQLAEDCLRCYDALKKSEIDSTVWADFVRLIERVTWFIPILSELRMVANNNVLNDLQQLRDLMKRLVEKELPKCSARHCREYMSKQYESERVERMTKYNDELLQFMEKFNLVDSVDTASLRSEDLKVATMLVRAYF